MSLILNNESGNIKKITVKNKSKKHLITTAGSLSCGKLLFALLSVMSMLLMLRNCDVAIEYMKNGLGICARTVIPSLFPFLVISELIVATGAAEQLGRILKKPMRAIFNVSGQGACAVILGAVCGFPIGARTAVGLYDKGAITKKECEHLLAFSNNPSSAFIISAVGSSLYNNRQLGVCLWIITLVTSLICGFIMKLVIYKKNALIYDEKTNAKYENSLGVHSFTKAVSSSALSMLTICAYVVFFASLIGALGNMLIALGAHENVTALLYAVFELSSGVSAAAGVTFYPASLILCAFALGWSGISVHCQIITLSDGRGISFRPYFFAKLIQGFLNILFILILFKFIPVDLFENVRSALL